MNSKNHSIPTLCIDTISSVSGITVVTLQLSYYTPLNPKMASEGIIETIDQTLKKASLSISDLKSVVVIKGPGSFTGLRVGISVANQFAHQLKIPIFGLKTHEWWGLRSEETQAIYLQSMNRAEVYLANADGPQILSLEKLTDFPPSKWFGELKFDHSEKLPPHFQALEQLHSIKGTWEKAIRLYSEKLIPQNIYALVEPFYGKEPNITKAKKVMGLNVKG